MTKSYSPKLGEQLGGKLSPGMASISAKKALPQKEASLEQKMSEKDPDGRGGGLGAVWVEERREVGQPFSDVYRTFFAPLSHSSHGPVSGGAHNAFNIGQ